jgi:hypothetical protein
MSRNRGGAGWDGDAGLSDDDMLVIGSGAPGVGALA